jgi:hypothetical protein
VRQKILVCLICLVVCTQVHADEATESEKMANIVKIMEITGVTKNAEIFIETATEDYYNSIKKIRSDVPDRGIQILKEEAKATLKDSIKRGEMVARIAPIFAKHYSEPELKELLKFYSSPLGKKVIDVSPVILQEVLAAGEEWQKSLAPELVKRVEQRLLRESVNP